MIRPAIGVTAGQNAEGAAPWFGLREEYVRAVEAAGGLPFVLVPGRSGDAEALLDRLDGLVVTGGADVDPALYHEAPHQKVYGIARDRDVFEVALCRTALARDLPLLAICRGIQVLNVATGGTLIQDIPSELAGAGIHYREGERSENAHEVNVMGGSLLRRLMGHDRFSVNSFHHQAVRRLGEGLIVSALSVPDRIVEAVEAPTRRFALGVQWHPESFWNLAESFQCLFEGLVRAGGQA